jgi:Ca2+-binding RTX toxin-like protein
MPGNGTTVVGGGGEQGSGYRIADHYVLTAGHVVYEWRNFGHFPAQLADGGLTVALDFRGYFSAFTGLLAGWATSWPIKKSNGVTVTSQEIAGHPVLAVADSVLLRSGSGSIGPGDDGLVVFLNPSDLTRTHSDNFLGSRTRVVRGDKSGTDSGRVDAINPKGAGTASSGPNLPWAVPGGTVLAGTLRFTNDSIGGDSGGAYLLRLEGREFVIGTHFANLGTSSALGTYFSYAEWEALNAAIRDGLTGNVTSREPTNLIVGSEASDGSVVGSYRADIILGRGGGETLIGEAAGSAAWGDDQLFGGSGNDILDGGRGNDLLHGGDHRAYGGTRTPLADDGEDSIDYTTIVPPGGTKGITLQLGGTAPSTAHQSNPDFSHAAFITDGNTNDVDTLISIEKVKATAQKDVLLVKALNPQVLANGDGKGGLAEFDMAANPKGLANGDLIDFHEMKAALKVDLEGERIELKSDPSIGFKVRNAENVHGGEGDDEIIGNASTNELRGGKGSDILKGGGGDDTLRGDDDGDEADQLYGEGGTDEIYAGNGDTVHVSSGDTIFLKGKTLPAGEKEPAPQDPCGTPAEEDDDEIKSGTYTSRDQTVYQYSKESHTLTVTTQDGSSITVLNWRNGDGGIRLSNKRPGLQQAECNRDPLILDLNGDRSVVAELYDVQVYFDIDNDGMKERIAWALPEDGLLVRDRNGDGLITNGTELFGSGTLYQRGVTGSGGRGAGFEVANGSSGFADLAELDTNRDGVIDAADAGCAELRVWQDANSDGITDAGELKTLAELGIVSISLRARPSDDLDCGCDGTRISEMSDATLADGSRIGVYDAFLAVDNYDSRPVQVVDIPADIAALPYLSGSGKVLDLHSAMVGDPLLREMVEALVATPLSGVGGMSARVEAIVLRWTGADRFAVDARGHFINTQWLQALEAIYGSEFRQNGTIYDPHADAASDLARAWFKVLDTLTAQLTAQIPVGQQVLPGLSFEAGAFFGVDAGVTLGDLLQSVASQAPQLRSDAIAYWHVALATLVAAAGEFQASASQIDAAAQPFLDAAGIELSAAATRRLLVGGGSELLTGTHRLINSTGNDVMLLSAGVAEADAGSGNDTYILAAGSKVAIRDAEGNDELWLPDLLEDQVLVSYLAFGSSYTLIVQSLDGATRAEISGELRSSGSGIETIRFADGLVRLTGDVIAAGAVATPFADIISARPDLGTVLDGGLGNDFLLGFDGDDMFVVGPGLGSDRVVERGTSSGDTIAIDAPLAAVSFAGGNGRDLLISFAGSADVVTIDGQRLLANAVVEYFAFSDGQTLTAAQVEARLLASTPGADTLVGSFRADRLDGGGGHDLLCGGAGLDTYVFGLGYGHDVVRDDGLSIIEFGAGIALADLALRRGGATGADLIVELAGGADILTVEGQFATGRILEFRFADGTSADWSELFPLVNTPDGGRIYGSPEDDTLRGSIGDDEYYPGAGRDVMFDPDGNDTYHLRPGNGLDVIIDYAGANDVIVLGAGVTLADLRWSRLYDDLVIRIGPDTLHIVNQFSASGTNGIETIRFADGQTFALNSLSSLLTGTSGNDYLFDISAAAANYPYYGRIFQPGAGDDFVQGSQATDTVRFEPGFGHDTLNGRFHLKFAAGLNAGDLRGRRDGDDLILSFVGMPDEIRVLGHYSRGPDHGGVESFSFADGASMYASQIDRIVLAPTAGDDWVRFGNIVGGVEQNVRDGGAGDDLLTGAGSLYRFDVGYGHDRIENTYSAGTVSFGSLTRAGVSFARSATNPWDIVATITASGETLTILGHYFYAGGPAEPTTMIGQFIFADATLTNATVVQSIIDAEIAAGARTVTSFGSEARVTVGAGDQTILVRDGGVNLEVGGGSGRDTLVHASSERMGPVRIFMSDIALGQLKAALFYDLSAAHPGWKIAIGSAASSSLIISDLARFYEDFGPVTVWTNLELTFGGGPQAIYGDGLAGILLGGLGGGQAAALGVEQIRVIAGTGGNDVIQSGAGNEVLAGLEGSDTFVLAAGTGHDIIAEALWTTNWAWEGYDKIRVDGWNRGDVTIAWREGSDTELVITAPGNVASMTFSVLDYEFHWVESVTFANGATFAVGDFVDELLAQGAAGNDNLRGDWRDQVLDAKGGNDRLAGGDGTDTYIFGQGYGHDTIVETPIYGGNVVQFLAGVTLADLDFARGGDRFEDLVITIRGTDSSLTILGEFGSGSTLSNNLVGEFRFNDGTALDWQDVRNLAAGRNLSGDNVLSTGSEGGLLDGGAGFDVLLGGTGNDIYLFDRGYDEDRIRDAGGDKDVLRFKAGVTVIDVAFNRVAGRPNDLIIEVNGRERLSLTIENQFGAASARIEIFEFEDGTQLSYEDVQRLVLRDASTSSADVILGFALDDRIDGRGGNDAISGGGGNDFIVGGAGRDIAVYSGHRSDYEIVRSGDEVTVRDLRPGGDGMDRLIGVEDLRFLADGLNAPLFNLEPPNSTPVVGDDSRSMLEDGVLVISAASLLANDSDADGDALKTTRVFGASGGEAWIGLDGAVRFRPAANFNGTASFSYEVVDPSGARASGLVTVTVADVNDAPRLSVGQLTVLEDGLSQPLVGSDLDGDPLTYSIARAPAHGTLILDSATGAYRYAPAPEYAGADSFAITVSDGRGGTDSAEVAVVVTPVNDSPVGVDAALAASAGQPSAGQVIASDVDDSALGFAVLLAPVQGSLALDPDSRAFIYRPKLGAGGVDEASILVTDAAGAEALVTLTFTIAPATISLAGGSVVEGAAAGTVIADAGTSADAAGTVLIFSLLDDAGGRFSIDPSSGIVSASGAVALDYETAQSHAIVIEVSDGEGSIQHVFDVAISNAPPSGIADVDATANSVAEDAPVGALVGITAASADPGGGAVTYSLANDAGGRFAIEPVTGIVTVAGVLDYETASSHAIVVSASDGSAATLQGFTIAIADVAEAAAIIGTDGPDVLTGTPGPDEISGLGGTDTLSGAAGDDVIRGGNGNDTIRGQAGADTMYGGAGNDLFDQDWDDGSPDHIYGEGGRDTIHGGDGDYADGGDDIDTFYVRGSNGTYHGGAGADLFSLTAGTTGNVIDGGVGSDTLSLSSGTVRLSGLAGIEKILGDGNTVQRAAIVFDIASIDLSEARFEMHFDLVAGLATGVTIVAPSDVTATPHASSLRILGGAGNDSLTGSRLADQLVGGTGDDILIGGAGADLLIGNAGDDTYRFAPGFGQDIVRDSDGSGGGGYDRIQFMDGILKSAVSVWLAGNGNDILLSVAGTTNRIRIVDALVDPAMVIEEVVFAGGTVWTAADLLAMAIPAPYGENEYFGTSVGETLLGGDNDDVIHGEGGGDIIYGYAGADTLLGGDGDDALFGGVGDDSLDGGDGNDNLKGEAGSDVLHGGAGDDIIDEAYDDSQPDQLFGDAGADYLKGGTLDQVEGGEGNDTLVIRGFNGTYLGGDGDDAFIVGFQGTVRNIVDGGTGFDTLSLGANASAQLWELSNIELIYASSNAAQRSKLTFDAQVIDLSAATLAGHVDLLVGTPSGMTIVAPGGASAGFAASIRMYGAAGADVLTGSSLGDQIIGQGGDDILDGGDGDDSLTGGSGNDSIFGGSGNDTAYFAGLVSSYLIEVNDGTVTVTDLNAIADGNDGTDTLQGVETLSFKGGQTFSIPDSNSYSFFGQSYAGLPTMGPEMMMGPRLMPVALLVDAEPAYWSAPEAAPATLSAPTFDTNRLTALTPDFEEDLQLFETGLDIGTDYDLAASTAFPEPARPYLSNLQGWGMLYDIP